MNQKVYRLPANRPIVWRTPHELQVGIDSPHTVVSAIPADATPVVHAMAEGVSDGGLAILQRQLRLSTAQLQGLLEQLEPAVQPEASLPPASITIVGTSPAIPVMAGVLDAMGVEIHRAGDIHDISLPGHSGLLLVADYVAHPDWVSVLGASNIPHTPVVFSDLTIRVGPHIRPGESPCLSCVEHHHRRHFPHWLAINSQLWGTRSPLATAQVGARAAVLAALCHGLMGFLPGSLGDTPGLALDYRPESGELHERVVEFDPLCTCRGLAGVGGLGNPEGPEEPTHHSV